MGTNAAVSPTTPKGIFTPRCSNTPKIRGSQDPRSMVTPESERKLDSQELGHTQDLRITESQNHRITKTA